MLGFRWLAATCRCFPLPVRALEDTLAPGTRTEVGQPGYFATAEPDCGSLDGCHLQTPIADEVKLWRGNFATAANSSAVSHPKGLHDSAIVHSVTRTAVADGSAAQRPKRVPYPHGARVQLAGADHKQRLRAVPAGPGAHHAAHVRGAHGGDHSHRHLVERALSPPLTLSTLYALKNREPNSAHGGSCKDSGVTSSDWPVGARSSLQKQRRAQGPSALSALHIRRKVTLSALNVVTPQQ